LHIDTWRVNVAADWWLPAYVYSEESSKEGEDRTPRIKSQVRFWGYAFRDQQAAGEFTAIKIEEPSVHYETPEAQQLTPVQGQRVWEEQAEQNVIERLSKATLLAPPNSVDKVLETVIRNLEITNNLNLEREVHCRVLLTSPLESFTVGHNLVLSRGLIDV